MTTRLLLIAVGITFCTITAFAQVEFAPIGAEWVYNVAVDNSSGPPTDPLVDYYTLTATGDSSIGNLTFRKVGPHLLHQEGDRVWYWHNDTLNLIYDFGLQVGDTTTFTFLFYDLINSVNLQYKVDKIDTINVNGIPLKIFFLVPTELFTSPLGYIYGERIGSVHQMIESHALEITTGDVAEEWLRCYKDTVVDYKSFVLTYVYQQTDCYYKPVNAAHDVESSTVSISPNPVTDVLHISTGDQQEISKVEVMDGMGKMVRSAVYPAAPNTTVHLQGLPAGIYFCNVFVGDKKRVHRVVIPW
jgi:Secretion system C-terminal sorting domain